MSLEIIMGSRGVGKTQMLVEHMIDNGFHHVFCANPEKMRERIHFAGGRDIAVYHYTDRETMNELSEANIPFAIDDLVEFYETIGNRVITTLSIKGE